MIIHCKAYIYAMYEIINRQYNITHHAFHANSLDWFMTERYELHSYVEVKNRDHGILNIKFHGEKVTIDSPETDAHSVLTIGYVEL